MHLNIDKKIFFLFLFLSLFFLTSINSQVFIKKKEAFYNLKSIEVTGLDQTINSEIEENLDFLKNTNIFFIDKKILKDQIKKYNFIEKYNVIKLYPSKIILELKQTEFLAKTIKNNEIFFIGSNGKFINIKKFNINDDLPLVFGKFTAKKFIFFKKLLKKSNLNYNNVKEIFFYPSGRIDIKNKDSVTIKFPKENLEQAISIASRILNNKNLKNNIIDLRIKNHLILSNE
tara:strand:- start:655 stop:1344 length:690 start_codon:yes stop_codon:yes gene_type:complete